MNNHQHRSTPLPELPSSDEHEHVDHAAMGHGEHHEHAGHGGHEGHVAIFRRLFWIMLGFSIPVLLPNSMFMSLIGVTLPHNAWLPWISPLLGTLMYAWGGQPFFPTQMMSSRRANPE